MSQQLCLEAVNVSMQHNYTNTVCRLLGRKAGPGTVIEHRYGPEIQARYVSRVLTGGDLHLRMRTREGILVLGSGIIPLRDVVVDYETGTENSLLAAVKKLCTKYDHLLVESNLKRRAAALRGSRREKLGRHRPVREAVHQYLLWQIYGVNEAWRFLLLHPEEKLLIRQQRVKIRRLRSCLIFFKGLLPEKACTEWQQYWRGEAETLSQMRELDVALMTCDRMRSETEKNETQLPIPEHLTQAFEELRRKSAADFFAHTSLRAKTFQAVRFYLWLNDVLAHLPDKHHAGIYVEKRICDWADKLKRLAEKYPDFGNMEDLHKIRIKVKRFRYVVQTVDLLDLNGSLLRKLKRLQDLLGFLHDDYVNILWAKKVAAASQKAADRKLLEQDLALFLGWGKGQAASAVLVLPDLWQDFLSALSVCETKNSG